MVLGLRYSEGGEEGSVGKAAGAEGGRGRHDVIVFDLTEGSASDNDLCNEGPNREP